MAISTHANKFNRTSALVGVFLCLQKNNNENKNMAKNCDEIAKMMDDLECTGVRVTKELIESRIVEVDYKTVVIAGQKLMYCGIRMDNGFVAVGKPATCIDPSNWRDEIGQKISYDNTFDELWKLEAYRLMSKQI